MGKLLNHKLKEAISLNITALIPLICFDTGVLFLKPANVLAVN
jgi:hypothetical protein